MGSWWGTDTPVLPSAALVTAASPPSTTRPTRRPSTTTTTTRTMTQSQVSTVHREPGPSPNVFPSRRAWGGGRGDHLLLPQALRRSADDRVQLLSDLGPPHLCQGQEDRHTRHLVLQVLLHQDQQGRGTISAAEDAAEEQTTGLSCCADQEQAEAVRFTIPDLSWSLSLPLAGTRLSAVVSASHLVKPVLKISVNFLQDFHVRLVRGHSKQEIFHLYRHNIRKRLAYINKTFKLWLLNKLYKILIKRIFHLYRNRG